MPRAAGISWTGGCPTVCHQVQVSPTESFCLNPTHLETVSPLQAYVHQTQFFILEDLQMLKTILTIGAIALLGLVALKIVFGVLPFMVSLLLFVVGLAIKVALVGGAIYLVVRIASPETARRIKAKVTGQLY